MKVGDKFVATKNVLGFLNEGDTVVVSNVDDNGMVYFIFSLNNFEGKGHMTPNEFNEYFKKVEEKKSIVSKESEYVPIELISAIMENSEFEVDSIGTCTIVACTLPSGFVIVESSVCANPDEYDEDTGAEICFDKIADKICQFETYRMMYENYINSIDESVDEEDECDCNTCAVTDCPDHPSYGEFFH